MFKRCSALIVSADGAWAKSFHTVLAEIGFGHIEQVADTTALGVMSFSRPLPFFFLSQKCPSEQFQHAMSSIRGHKKDETRFSPMIMMARGLSREQINSYISIGVDDIVQFPCSLKGMADRLKRQLGKPQKYFQTESYFGPDRRRQLDDTKSSESSRGGTSAYRSYLIQREPFRGVRVLDIYDHQPKDEVVGQTG